MLPENAYTATTERAAPTCWWGRARWIAHCLALYDAHYKALRAAGAVESVARKTFAAYLIGESAGADHVTGRNSRVTVGRLQHRVARSESTIHRCRRLVDRIGCRTVVFAGRRRTLAERLESWKRNDRARGWAAVSALHESTALPVDNSAVETLLEQGFGTPPERSDGFSSLSRPKSASSTENERKRRASRGTEQSRRRKISRAYDQKATLLAERCRRDERMPLWVRRITRNQLAAALTRYARAGWLADDIYGALEEFRISGKRLIANPDKPIGYLCHILRFIPKDVPPALLDRARTVAAQEAERAANRALFAEMRAAAANAAAADSPGRVAARAAIAQRAHHNADHARTRARQADEISRAHALRARDGRQ
ncbi:Replication protein Rep [Nocardia sp. alder85J]|uniref:Replication protein Rep n=1 Tax=Nocardia sp. alder85J TaxID=2862949 RepID=UPI0022536CD5|nr:Replication protein Rep [Nocardia sp. alder85J]MCX4099101.1 Replication protein Rep [Nocardia sp. alder85J]